MDIVDALLSGQRRAQQAGRKSHSRPDTFGRGAAWVETMLVPSIHQAASALEVHGVTIRLDTNLDRKSTNHAHADFWLATKDNSLQGPKHSINGGLGAWSGWDCNDWSRRSIARRVCIAYREGRHFQSFGKRRALSNATASRRARYPTCDECDSSRR